MEVKAMRAAEFLSLLFPAVPGHLALWRGDTKGTKWVLSGDWGKAEAFADAAAKKPFDAYFGVCLQARDCGADSRGSIETAAAVPGVWIDLDFQDKPHSGKTPRKKNYPTREVVETMLAGLPIPASLQIFTGGGIHAYWLFDVPFEIKTEEDRQRIAGVVQSWQGLIKTRLLKAGGFGVDSTFDLARVLRLPGSVHTKHDGLIVDVDATSPGSRSRYKLDQIENFLYKGNLPTAPTPPAKGKPATKPAAAPATKPAAAPPAKPKPAAVWNVTANEGSEPPGTRFINLCEASPEFKQLWDKKVSKPSPSEYDMSLANHAINAGWTDQEAAGLLVAFSKRHFPDHLPKLLRVTNGVQDYLKLTITKAHDSRRKDAANREAEAAVDSLAIEVRDAQSEGREVNREIVLTKVSEFLGVPVAGFRQTGRRDEVYSLLIGGAGKQIQEIIVGGATAIHSSPSRICERIMAEAGKYVAVSKKLKTEWGAIVAGLIAIREFHEVKETDLADRVSELIVEHLRRFRGGWLVQSAEARSDQAKEGRPFIEEKKLFVSATALKRLAGEVDRGLAAGDMFVGLRQLAFEQVTVSLSTAKTSRSYWRGPYEGFEADEPAGAPTPRKPGDAAGKAMKGSPRIAAAD